MTMLEPDQLSTAAVSWPTWTLPSSWVSPKSLPVKVTLPPAVSLAGETELRAGAFLPHPPGPAPRPRPG